MSKIIAKEVDFAKWYTSIIENAQLVDYGLVKGTIVFKPYGWAIWKNIVDEFTKILASLNTQECCLPLLIPYSEFTKEKDHVEGFDPELFKVSYLGNKKIEDELVIRPTSEILFCHYFKKNVNSYNDLPLILNQWCNVFRVEKNTRPFLRTSEFFWQEQHAVFASEKQAYDFAIKMVNVYQKFVNDFLSIAVLMGEKTVGERFAGAINTFTIEALMPDGQVLQSATSHYLGQNFAKPFSIKFANQNNNYEFAFQTSAGLSTRIIGAIIMSHSDNFGLVLPFKIAPVQFAILYPSEIDINDKQLQQIKATLKDFRIELQPIEKSFGMQIQKNEIKGIPFQIILGKKEMELNQVTIYQRDIRQKSFLNIADFNTKQIQKMINNYCDNLFNNSLQRIQNSIVYVDNLNDFNKAIKDRKVVTAYWNGDKEDENKLKNLTSVVPRCYDWKIPSDPNKKCFFTNKPNARLVYFARAY
ncbi:MAG: proline--tRNA ligase [Malacoplasma sp.]|nr:proline--tRNA ligase [Malacoplasma sp.]